MKWLSTRLENLSKLDYYVKPNDNGGRYIRLDSNENLTLSRRFALEIIAKALNDVDLRLYPNQEYEDSLYRQLEKYLSIEQKYIAAGSGSDQIIELLLSTIGRGKRGIVLTPTFSYFLNRCELHGLKLDRVPLRRENNNICEKDFFELAKHSDIVYICSPNNPTGNQFDKELMSELISNLQNKLILIDEAYVEFAEYSLASSVTKYENVVVLRTLSKAFGLAGARVGYMIASEKLTRVFRSRIQLPYSLGTLPLRIASLALARNDQVRKTIEKIKMEREKIFENISKINGIKVSKSDSNFLFLECCEKFYDNIAKQLQKERVAVRMFGNVEGRTGCLRVTVGTREMNERFLRAIEIVRNHNKI
jgi:histidinol-phosphate aminotransferase